MEGFIGGEDVVGDVVEIVVGLYLSVVDFVVFYLGLEDVFFVELYCDMNFIGL